MRRPICVRCGRPLDLAWDRETGRYEWSCNNLRAGRPPAQSDDEFADLWGGLAEGEAARLKAEVKPKAKA